MVHSARRPFIAFAFFLVLLCPAMARASVIYDFVTTAYTGTIPHFAALTDIRVTLSDDAHASGVVNFDQTAGLDPFDPPTTIGSGVEQFSWWVGNRLPANASNFHFEASLIIQPDNSLSGDIFFAGLEDTLFLTYDALDGIWRGAAFSDRPPVCSGEIRTCTFEGYFAQVTEPGTLSVLAGVFLVFGFAMRRASAR